jgi:cysteine desulfurase
MKLPVYMDYHATTPVDPRVLEVMLPYFSEKFGNSSSRQHSFGWMAEEGVESARASVARSIGCEPKEIIFTAGATEANNLALKGVAEAYRAKGDHIVTAQTEHKSVLDTCKKLEKSGMKATFLPVDAFGVVDPGDVRKAITPRTILVSVMLANNEIGTIQDVGAIGEICRERGVLLHTDATQAVGKIPVDVDTMKVDLLSLSGHKVYGPKGIGALYVRSRDPRVAIVAQTDGGGHERGLRSGTLNVPGIVGLGAALSLAASSREEEYERTKRLRDRMLSALTSGLDEVYLNGHPALRLPNNLNLSFTRVDENALMMSMKDVAVSTGSACSSSTPEPSHVLRALGLPLSRLNSAIRFGLGRMTTEEETEYVITRVLTEVRRLRSGARSIHVATAV